MGRSTRDELHFVVVSLLSFVDICASMCLRSVILFCLVFVAVAIVVYVVQLRRQRREERESERDKYRLNTSTEMQTNTG